MIGKSQKFLSEVLAEMKKVSWLSKPELKDSTQVVIVSSVLLGLFIAATDFILSILLNLIIR
jgi:preprotein translocase SecE subunit